MNSSNFTKKVLDKIEKLDLRSIKEFILELTKEREFFETIFESIIEGVIVLDADNNIKYINQTAKDMFQLTQTNIIGRDFFCIFIQDSIYEIFKDIINLNKIVNNQEIEINYPEKKILRVNVFPLLSQNDKIGNVIMLLDITIQKEEEIRLRTAESLASLTTLAAGVAHEIKNPLGAIDIHVQLLDRLAQKISKPIKDDFTELLKIIREEIERLNNIIGDFLFTVRPAKINKKDEDIEEIIRDLIKLLKYDFTNRNIKVEFTIQKVLPKIFVDKNLLKHAFINILKNSMEAINKNGIIRIKVYRKYDDLVIEFSDTGKGIEKENQNKIFEPFFTTKDFGTGLGLTIVYKVIQEHNGSINVESLNQKGTISTIILPIFDKSKKLIEYEN